MRRHLTRIAASLALLVVAALAWPAALGGGTTFVATRGSSMEPNLRQGDLGIVRGASAYHVGDVVAYRSDLLETVVLHRIVAVDGDRLTLQGDNNAFVDPDRPRVDAVIGRLVVRVPHAGRALSLVRAAAIPAAALALLLLFRRSGSTHTSRGDRIMTKPRSRTRSSTHLLRRVAVGAGVTFVASASLAALAAARPATEIVEREVPYTHEGSFTYGADVAPSPVYPDGLTTGDPVYLRLARAINVAFDYRLDAADTDGVHGDIALDAVVSDDRGWRHEIVLAPPRSFDGPTARTAGTLDISRVHALVAEVEAATGVNNAVYTVSLAPQVELADDLGAERVASSFSPQLEFQLDDAQLRPAHVPSSADASTMEAERPMPDPLRPREGWSMAASTRRPGELRFRSVAVPVDGARRASVVVGAVALTVLGASAAGLRRRLDSEAARIELRHGHRLVGIGAPDLDCAAATFDVESMDDLVRVADQHGGPMLHHDAPDGHHFIVVTEQAIFRYVADANGGAAPTAVGAPGVPAL